MAKEAESEDSLELRGWKMANGAAQAAQEPWAETEKPEENEEAVAPHQGHGKGKKKAEGADVDDVD